MGEPFVRNWAHVFQTSLLAYLEGLSRRYLEVPYPRTATIEQDLRHDSLIICLIFDENITENNRSGGEQLRFSIPSHYRNISIIESQLDVVIAQIYGHFLIEKDHRLLNEAFRRIERDIPLERQYLLLDANFQRSQLRRRMEDYYNSSPRYVRFFTLRNVDEEYELYVVRNNNDNVYRISENDHYAIEHVFPSNEIRSLRATTQEVITNLDRTSDYISQILLGNLRPDYFLIQLQKLIRIEEIKNRRISTRIRTDIWSREIAENLRRDFSFREMLFSDFGDSSAYQYNTHVDSSKQKEANRRGIELLKQHLTEEQLAQYERYKWFIVKGGSTGNRYKIHYGTQMNIHLLDEDGNSILKYCFLPIGNLCAGDVMLSQKISLELDEEAALAVANKFNI